MDDSSGPRSGRFPILPVTKAGGSAVSELTWAGQKARPMASMDGTRLNDLRQNAAVSQSYR